MNPDKFPFGKFVHAYTRQQALADGDQIDVSETAREAGIRFPVFITRAVFEAYVVVPPGAEGQDEAGRLWDVLWMTRWAIGESRPEADRVSVSLHVRNDHRRPKLEKLVAMCGPLDLNDPQPAITIMLPGEDWHRN